MTFREFEGKNAVTETIGDQAASLLGALNMPMDFLWSINIK